MNIIHAALGRMYFTCKWHNLSLRQFKQSSLLKIWSETKVIGTIGYLRYQRSENGHQITHAFHSAVSLLLLLLLLCMFFPKEREFHRQLKGQLSTTEGTQKGEFCISGGNNLSTKSINMICVTCSLPDQVLHLWLFILELGLARYPSG